VSHGHRFGPYVSRCRKRRVRDPPGAVRQAYAGAPRRHSVRRSRLSTRGSPQRGLHDHHRCCDPNHDGSYGSGFDKKLYRRQQAETGRRRRTSREQLCDALPDGDRSSAGLHQRLEEHLRGAPGPTASAAGRRRGCYYVESGRCSWSQQCHQDKRRRRPRRGTALVDTRTHMSCN
ncbi:unnamed protein product, partial [Ectocarpus fasciculatus]